MKRSSSQSLADLQIFLNGFIKIIIIIVQVTVTAKQHLADNLNPVKKMKNFIEENTVWICLANIIVIGFKFITFWASIMVTMMQEGATGVLTVLYVFWCS